MSTHADLIILHAGELLTCPESGGLGIVQDGAVAIVGERIERITTTAEMLERVSLNGATVIDAGGQVVLPGFVDCHTHVVFGASRVDEYAAKVSGEDLELVRASGAPVGIRGTVAHTSNKDVEELVDATAPRLQEMLSFGTTTVESKSGYGLTVESELNLLRANKILAAELALDIVSTFMGGHAIPPDTTQDSYTRLIIDEMLPRVVDEDLAVFNDVWCEQGYFDLDHARRILEAGIAVGLLPKLHLDQITHTGAAAMAAELGCVSVDHCNLTTDEELRLLAAADVTAVAMPGIDFATDQQPPVDCLRLMASGMTVALATDICPGGWIPSMQLIIAFACRLHGMSPAEAVVAATRGAAKAVGLAGEIGTLSPGARADVLVLDVPRHEDLAYRIGRNAVKQVIARGEVVVSRAG